MFLALLQETTRQPNTLPLKIGCFIMRHKGKKAIKVEDEF